MSEVTMELKVTEIEAVKVLMQLLGKHIDSLPQEIVDHLQKAFLDTDQ